MVGQRELGAPAGAVNYRTVVANLEVGWLSRRMRNPLRAYQEPEAERPEEMGRRVAETSGGEREAGARRASGRRERWGRMASAEAGLRATQGRAWSSRSPCKVLTLGLWRNS